MNWTSVDDKLPCDDLSKYRVKTKNEDEFVCYFHADSVAWMAFYGVKLTKCDPLEEGRKKMKSKTIFFLSLVILAIPPTCYRFKHPEKSETQLFLDFFKAYKEFFCAVD